MGIAWHEIAAAMTLHGGDFDTLQVATATGIARQHYPELDPGHPALLLGLEDPTVAARLSALLSAAYPTDWGVVVSDDAGSRAVALTDLPTAVAGGRIVHVFIPPLPAPSSFQALQGVIAHLRAPDGCPWDQALTWAKLRGTLLEETYELLAALDADDAAKVAEEQGDLLVQVAMQAQIAAEEGRFRMPDVIRLIVEKLVRRHPHVFGDAVVSGTEEVLANWEAIKRVEREQNGAARSPLAGVPSGLPALAQADAYLDRMSRLNEGAAPAAPWARLAQLGPDEPLAAEVLGQALFELVGWARARGVDPESALRETNARFAEHVAASEAGSI